jgi:hypothetical protein
VHPVGGVLMAAVIVEAPRIGTGRIDMVLL